MSACCKTDIVNRVRFDPKKLGESASRRRIASAFGAKLLTIRGSGGASQAVDASETCLGAVLFQVVDSFKDSFKDLYSTPFKVKKNSF